MKRIGLILMGVWCLVMTSYAEQKTDAMLFGDVKSANGKEHLPYAVIMVKGTTLGTMADGSGHFKLANLPVGECTIRAQLMGYKSQEKKVVMEKNKAVELFFELQEDALNLEQVVVTGTRTQHFIKDVPVRTEVITTREIESKNAATIYDALENIPGIRVENQCQFCNFTMVRMQGLGAEHTQVLINGQPIYSGLAGVYGLQQVSTVDIDRIEVVKGAGSALYGSSAVAGAVNIMTREPGFEPATRASLQFGNHNTNHYDISSSIRNEKGNIGLTIFAQKLTGDAIDETGSGLTKDEVDNQDGISDRVKTNLTTAGFGLSVSGLLFRDDKLSLRGKSLFEKRQGGTMDDDYYRNPLTDGTESISTDRYELQLGYSKKIGSLTELNFNSSYANHNRDATNDSYLGDYMATHQDSVPDVRTMRPYLADENSLSLTLTLAHKLGCHDILFGLQGYFDQLDESGMYVVVDEESDFVGESYRSKSDKSAREFGVFLQDEWAITDKLTAVPGIRLDQHHSEEEYQADRQVFLSSSFPKTDFDETSVNPRLALKYSVSDRIAVRLNAGTGFRAPYGFSEDLHLCSGSPRVWKSSDLDPERSMSYNISADYYGHTLRFSANLFRTDLKDKIGFTDAEEHVSALGYDYQWKNIDDAWVQGVEMALIVSPVRNLDFEVDLTYNQGEYDHVRSDWVGTPYESDSKKISRFPEITGNVKIDYTRWDWSLALSGDYQGQMVIDYYNEEIDPEKGDRTKIKKTDDFMLFNAYVSKRIGMFKLYGGIDNIFNYLQDEKHLDDAAFVYAPVYGTLYYGGITIDLKH
ncbi:MAG: TonB-dependent receptor [Candidatus Delongbacteria bacterium]|nr:TonB-dependent receptor [Candidatus Delongbacteria bacterium]